MLNQVGMNLVDHYEPCIRFKNSNHMIKYVIDKIDKAEEYVLDLTFQRPDDFTNFTRKNVIEYYDSILRNSKRITYKEIIMFYALPKRINKVKKLTLEGDNYYAKKYDDLSNEAPNQLQFLIIDGREVIFENLAIQDKNIVQAFKDYYNELFTRAKYIDVDVL